VVAERGAVAGFAVHDVLPKPVDGHVVRASLVRAGVSPSPSRTVLVVDDDPTALQLMSTTLHELGYQTRCESDARVALETFDAAPASAIVLDLLMPGMSGFEFLDLLRRVPEGREVPVIVWTSKDLSSVEHEILRTSANAVVSKGHGGSAGVIAELATHFSARRNA
jgi:CheY-like chemotaxis protein